MLLPAAIRAQSTPLPSDRGRIAIATIPDAYNPSGPALKVLRTDTNTPLRAGTAWIWDKSPQEQPESYYASMQAKGLNGVRMILFDMWETEAYAPSATFTPTDWNDPAYRTRQLARMERAVNYASAHRLYVIINCHNKIPLYNATYADALWTYVAPYFANRTHVIYEASNEPISGIGNNGNLEAELPGRLQQLKTSYNIIRAGAPNTHIMIFSPPGVNDYGFGTGMGNLAESFAALPGAVDWSKTSLAYHLYSTDGGPFPQAQNLRNLHSRFAGWPSENNFPASVSNATLGITDPVRSGSFAGHEYINQTCEFLGLGWSMWNINGQTQLDQNWPVLWADAVAKNYSWNADALSLTAPSFTSSLTATISQSLAGSIALVSTPGIITYSATGLPAGMILNTNSGLINGTPTVAGNFQVALTATNSAGTTPATLNLTITPTQETSLYSEAFPTGTAGWWSYSGGTGVTSALTSASTGTTDGKVLRLAIQGASSWYAGIGTSRPGTPPFTASNLARLFVRGRIQITSPSGKNYSLILKTGNNQTLTFNATAPGTGWADFTVPLSSFTNSAFKFTASAWEILIVPDGSNWGLGNSTLQLDFIELTRLDDITDPLLAWRKIHFNTTAATGNSADNADADGDGLHNLVEYALGSSPVASSAGVYQVQVINKHLQLTFTPQRSDIIFAIESSPNLSNWTPIPIAPAALSTGQPYTFTDPVEISSNAPPSRFIRLTVARP